MSSFRMYIRKIGVFIVAIVVLQLTACASYYSHYGRFEAQNSKGEVRQFRVSWQTQEYPDWSFFSNDATEITLEAQCSTRKWHFRDNTFGRKFCNASSEGIISCGDPNLDLKSNGQPVVGDNYVCATISDRSSTKKIVDLGYQLEINMKCWPASTEYTVEGKKKFRDYLKQSNVAYSVATTKVVRYSLQDKKPDLPDKICKKK